MLANNVHSIIAHFSCIQCLYFRLYLLSLFTTRSTTRMHRPLSFSIKNFHRRRHIRSLRLSEGQKALYARQILSLHFIVHYMCHFSLGDTLPSASFVDSNHCKTNWPGCFHDIKILCVGEVNYCTVRKG